MYKSIQLSKKMIFSLFSCIYHPLTMSFIEDITKQLTSSLSSLLENKLKIYIKYLIDTYCTKDAKKAEEIMKKSLTYWNEQKFDFTLSINSDTLDKKATKICSAKTKDGNTCKGKCTKDSDLCASHSKKGKKKSKKSDDDDCTTCQTKIKSGKRQGEKCGSKVKGETKYCGRHQDSDKSESENEEDKKKSKKDSEESDNE